MLTARLNTYNMSISENKQYARKQYAQVNTICAQTYSYAEMNMLPEILGHKLYAQIDYTQTQTMHNYTLY